MILISDTSIGNRTAWLPTFTGFSADPTSITANYILFGKLCYVYLTSTGGTSNATDFTVTLPFAAANTAIQHLSPIQVTNNGTLAFGRIKTRANSNILDVYPSATATAWTASGSKNAVFSFVYEIE